MTTPSDGHVDFEALVSDLPIDIIVDPSGDTVRILHFRSRNTGNGYATEALNRIIKTAEENHYTLIILHIGRGRDEDDVEGFIRDHMGFTIDSATDRITASYSLN